MESFDSLKSTLPPDVDTRHLDIWMLRWSVPSSPADDFNVDQHPARFSKIASISIAGYSRSG